MSDAAALNRILHRVTRPARYTGGEWNSIVKDWKTTTVRVALSYPDAYEVGMSNMALPILYELLNSREDVLAERVFAPWIDMAAAIREASIPLFSLESRRPLSEFDIIGFSLGYELTYSNVLEMLDLAGIPVLAAERDGSWPLVIAGDSGTLNPEPMADFIDLFVIGDGEEVIGELIDTYAGWREEGIGSRESLLRLTAAIPGIYIPRFYDVEYSDDGTISSVTPNVAEASPKIRQRIVNQLPPPVAIPVVPHIEVIHDRGGIEIQRGCSRGCRFCQAGIIYRPVRQRPLEEVIDAAEELVNNCGYADVSLVSLSTSDYPAIGETIRRLEERLDNVALSLPSLYANSFTVDLMDALSTRKKIGLTFAPEAGSERLRRIINKNVSEEELLTTFAAIFERGWTNLKLYFMLGLPEETTEDVAAIVDLVNKIRALGKSISGGTPQLRVSLSTFVPKPHTPFQWVAQAGSDDFAGKQELLRAGLRRKSTRVSWSDPAMSRLEAVISRGDRRLGEVIHRAWQSGAVFDAWNEHFEDDHWREAFAAADLDPDFYARRERSLNEVLPWGHIDSGVSHDFLRREYRRALEESQTPDCRFGRCLSCGLEETVEACREKRAAD